MGLFIVTVDANDEKDGRGWYFDVAVIADSIRGAKVKASRGVASNGYLGARSVDAVELDVYSTGVILVAKKEPVRVDALDRI